MKNFLKKFKAGLMALAIMTVVGGSLVSNVTPAKAAADPSITTGIASATAAIGDNISPIVTYVIYALIAVFGLSMVVLLIVWGLGKIKRVFGGGRRRGRRG